MQAKMFSKVDTDSSGGVDKTELQSLIDDVAKKSGVTNSSTDEMFSKMDANSDGNLSTDELGKGMKEIMPPPSTLDFAQSRSESGNTPEGAGGPPPPAGGAGGADSASSSTYDPLDTNQDGTVSAAERLAGNTSTDAVQTLLKAIDADGDSQISTTESDAFMTQLTAQLESASSTSSAQSATAANDQLDLVKLVQQAYEQIANGLTQQSKGSTLSTLA
jgi:Ca2+-binding EF-hand superfamily protein